MYFNRIILVGRLTRDPELRTTLRGIPVVRFSLAVDRGSRENDGTDFFDIVAFQTTAETVANYMTKGRLVLVEGRVQIRTYLASDGSQRRAFEVIASTVRFLESRSAVESPTHADITPVGTPADTYEDQVQSPTQSASATASEGYPAAPPNVDITLERTPSASAARSQRTAQSAPTPPPTPEPDEEPDFDFDYDPEEMDDTDDDPFR